MGGRGARDKLNTNRERGRAVHFFAFGVAGKINGEGEVGACTTSVLLPLPLPFIFCSRQPKEQSPSTEMWVSTKVYEPNLYAEGS